MSGDTKNGRVLKEALLVIIGIVCFAFGMTLLFGVLGLLGCAMEPPAAEETACGQLDECNALTGLSPEECTDDAEVCLDGLSPEEADRLREAMRACEGFDCDAYSACLLELQACWPTLPECGPSCEFCWWGTDRHLDCPLDYSVDGSCDCGCQFEDAACP